MAKRKTSVPAKHAETTLSEDVEPAYSYADLERRGEGSRWTIDRRVRDGTYPLPDHFVGPYPRWLASTNRRHREALITFRDMCRSRPETDLISIICLRRRKFAPISCDAPKHQ